MADKNINIRINADDKASGVLGRVGGGLRKLGGMLGMYFGARAIAGGVKSAVNAFIEQENATEDLRSALAKTGEATAGNMQKFQKLAQTIQSLTTMDDDAVVSQIAYAKNLGVTTDQLESVTTAAIGLSKMLRVDMSTAMMLVARASQGNTQTLTRYGIKIDESLSKAQKFNVVLKAGNSNFRLATEEAGRTAGRLAQLNNAWGDMKEGIGQAIVEGSNLPTVLDEIAIRMAAMNKSGAMSGLSADLGLTLDALKPLKTVLDGILDTIAAVSAVLGKGTENAQLLAKAITSGDIKGVFGMMGKSLQPLEEGSKAFQRRATERVAIAQAVNIERGEREQAKQKILSNLTSPANAGDVNAASNGNGSAWAGLSGGKTISDVCDKLDELTAK